MKKFEKVGAYLKISDTVTGSVEVLKPTKDISYKNYNETIQLLDSRGQRVNRMAGYPFSDNAATGSVTIDTVSPTKASGTITCATVLENTFATGTITCATVLEIGSSTGTITCASVLADAASTGTITCVSVDTLTKASGTIQCISVIATDAVTVNGLLYTAVSGAKANDTEFSVDTGDTACALDLADSINNDGRSGTLNDLTAISTGDTAIVTQTVGGVGGNATAMSTSDATITLSGATFTGGLDADTATVNGLVYTAVSGVKADNTEFSTDTSDTATAIDLAASITNDSRSGTLNDVTATNSTGVVTCTQSVKGTGGDATTLVSSDGTTLAVSGATFSGGVDADTATVNGLVYTAVDGAKADNTEFSVDTGDNETAADLALSITNDSRTGTLDDVTATDSTGVVTCTQTVGGTGGDATTLTSTDGTTLAVSGATFSGGVDADTVTVNGLVYTAVAGSKAGDFTKFSTDTSDTATAVDLADSITNDARAGTTGDQTATDSTGVVTVTTDVLGTSGNAITLVSSDGATLAVSGATLSGGIDADTVTVNGLVYTAIAGSKAGDFTKFSTDTSDTATATDLADSITNDVRTGTLNDVTATDSTGVVTATTSIGGTVGNPTTLTSTDGTTLAVSGATFSGGLDDAEVSGILVNLIETMSGAETAIEDTDVLATQVAANITANTSTPNYTAVAVGAVVTITAADEDTGVNGFVVTSTVVKATSTDVNMAGATNNIVDDNDVPFTTFASFETFLRNSTGS